MTRRPLSQRGIIEIFIYRRILTIYFNTMYSNFSIDWVNAESHTALTQSMLSLTQNLLSRREVLFSIDSMYMIKEANAEQNGELN
jgi:hypothetical protein